MQGSEQKRIFDSWIDQHKALLFKVVRAYAFDADDRDDLFQEITVQIWKSIPRYKKESAVTTWLYRVSLNTALAWKRKQSKHREGRQEMDGVQHLLRDNDLVSDERLVWLYEEIAGMSKMDKSLTLLLLDGFSYKEMANMIGISEGNVGVKISRIKKRLVKKSEKYDHYEIR